MTSNGRRSRQCRNAAERPAGVGRLGLGVCAVVLAGTAGCMASPQYPIHEGDPAGDGALHMTQRPQYPISGAASAPPAPAASAQPANRAPAPAEDEDTPHAVPRSSVESTDLPPPSAAPPAQSTSGQAPPQTMSEIGDVRFERAVARDRSSLLAATLRGVISDDGRTMSAPAAGFETVVLHHRRRHGAAPKDKAAKADAHGKSSRRHKHGETASLSRSARRHDRLRARLETEAEADAPAAELETPYQTTVRPGERAADVAARLHVSKQALMSLNDIKATSKLRPGETLKTPYRLAYTVGQGDTLFAIAHRFGENMDALAKLNGLKHAAALHLGQTIALPLTAEDAGPRGHAEGASPKPEAAPAKLIEAELSKARAASARRAERQQAMAIAAAAHEAPPVASASQSPGSQTTQSGSEPDNGVRMAAELNERELASRAVPPAAAGYSVANEMAANRAPASPSRAQASTSAAPAPGQIATLNNPGYYPPGYNAPVLGRVRPTAPTGSSGPVTDADVSSAGRGLFVWPLRGVILTPFGDRGPGQRNDGLDISASPGESVRAAASGEVVYAGSSIPGFGNLVLVKHAGGWVTAYAHLDRIEVRMRDEVSQGEEIGQAGQTGAVDRPELHFEIRYAPDPAEKARPVDPTLVLPGAG